MNNSSTEELLNRFYADTAQRLYIVVVGGFGMLLNLLVCRVIICSKKTHQPLDRLILNLAVVDLLNASALVSYHILELATYTSSGRITAYSWLADNILCKLWVLIFTFTMASCNLTLATISIERCRAILYPFNLRLTKKRLNFFIIINGCIAIMAASLMMAFHRAEDQQPHYCTGVNNSGLLGITVVTYTICTNVIPFSIIVVCYISIGFKLCRNRLPVDSVSYRNQVQDVTNRKKRKVIILIIVTILSMATSTQYLIIHTFVTFGRHIDEDIYSHIHISFWNYYRTTWMIALLTCVINPLLYNFCSDNFNHTLRSIIKQHPYLSYICNVTNGCFLSFQFDQSSINVSSTRT